MAASNYEPVGVTTERWLYRDRYKGTAEALIGAKIIARCDLPGEPGNNRMMVTRGRLHEPGYMQTTRRVRKRTPDIFDVRIDVSPEEVMLRRTAADAVIRERQESECVKDKAARDARLKATYGALSAEAFLSFLDTMVNCALWSVHDSTEGNTPRRGNLYSFQLERQVGNESTRLLKLALKALEGAKAIKIKSSQDTATSDAFQRSLIDRDFQRFIESQGLRG